MFDSAVSWVTVVKPTDEGLAFTPFIHSVASLHALSAGRSALLACSTVSDVSTTAAACFVRASLQADETVCSFALEHPERKIRPTRAETAMGAILVLMPYAITMGMEHLNQLLAHGLGFQGSTERN